MSNKKGLAMALAMLSLGGRFPMSLNPKGEPFSKSRPFPEMRDWGRRKRERYDELMESGTFSEEQAFDIVENHKGVIPEGYGGKE